MEAIKFNLSEASVTINKFKLKNYIKFKMIKKESYCTCRAHMMRLVLFNSLDFIIINEQLKLNYIGVVYKNKYVYIIHPIINFI